MRSIVLSNKPYWVYIFQDYRLCFFVISLALYGCLSSPTPDNPNWVELCIASLLIAVIGSDGFFQGIFNVFKKKNINLWQITGVCFFCYGIIVPSIIALFYDLSLKIYLRDIIAFGFLCLPLFLASFLKNDVIRQDIFKKLLLFIGLAFSLRVIFLDFSFFTQADALLYLANSPLVLFTALYLILSFGHCLAFFKSYGDLKWLMFFVSLSLLPMLAMAIDFQRASFLAIAVAVLSYGILLCVKTPMKMILPFVVVITMVIFLFPYIEMIVENIAVKTSKVGLNMRYQEALAVWTIVSQHSWSLFFGLGWGAEFTSPAVGNLNVGYTHSLLTYMFLKSGLIGLGLTLFYLFFILQKAIRLTFIDSVWGNALIWPFIIPVILYASYKSLDFGLIMTLILLMDNETGRKES